MSLVGIELSRYTIAAILMLMDYSVNYRYSTYNKGPKEKGDTINQKVRNAMKTGLMMTFTTLAALSLLSHILNFRSY